MQLQSWLSARRPAALGGCMSGRWWRAYSRARHDPKLLKLSDKTFRWWFNIVCVAADNDGVLPSHADLAVEFRTSGAAMTKALDELVSAGLLDHDETGIHPHNWNGLQYKSDVSNERVKRYRERHRNGECNVTETPSESEAETEPDTEQKEAKGKRVAIAPALPLDDAVQAYNETAEQAGWAKVQRLTSTRTRSLTLRLQEAGGLEGWQHAMAKAAESRFLTGKTTRSNGHANWRPDFDWFTTASNFTKLMEGSYDNAPNAQQPPERGLGAALAALAD